MIPTRSRPTFPSSPRSRQPITRWLDVKPLYPEFRVEMRESRPSARDGLGSPVLSHDARQDGLAETRHDAPKRAFWHTPLSRRVTGRAVQILKLAPVMITEAAPLRPLSAALILGLQIRLLELARKRGLAVKRGG